nr:PREDICTED: phorbol ester/diacylglycerol-binding protein unc-13 [Tribolium castaneum]|eukprot:XP_015840276.1 PREDICTED: phorbol ester/diacylglycerol-binding protein unc-13 [Tribolium castaneum]
MMSLLSVTVKKARYVGAQASQFNTYVTLKLQNVKSTTVTVKGATPCWEQDFLFETNDLNTGLLIEVWSKGMIWDRAMGYHWIPLQTVQYSNEEGNGQWLSLEAELVMRDGEVVGTKNPTGHSLLVDCRFELPFDPENIEAGDLQRKLEMLNNIMDQEARMDVQQPAPFSANSNHFDNEISAGYSEDSDYTSDLNYPVGQHANSSASQFRSAAHQINTPQRSLETSRENSYERDDGPGHHHLAQPMTHQHHLSPGSHRRHQRYSPGNDEYNYSGPKYQDANSDFDPLFYNSRPRNKPDYSSRRRKYEWEHEESQETWASCETSFYNQSVDSVDYVDSQYYNNQSRPKARRPSLERQSTLYDDSTYYGDSIYYPNDNITQVNCVDMR